MNDTKVIGGSVQLPSQAAPALQPVKLLKDQVVAGSVRLKEETVFVEAELASQWIAAQEAVAVETVQAETPAPIVELTVADDEESQE